MAKTGVKAGVKVAGKIVGEIIEVGGTGEVLVIGSTGKVRLKLTEGSAMGRNGILKRRCPLFESEKVQPRGGAYAYVVEGNRVYLTPAPNSPLRAREPLAPTYQGKRSQGDAASPSRLEPAMGDPRRIRYYAAEEVPVRFLWSMKPISPLTEVRVQVQGASKPFLDAKPQVRSIAGSPLLSYSSLELSRYLIDHQAEDRDLRATIEWRFRTGAPHRFRWSLLPREAGDLNRLFREWKEAPAAERFGRLNLYTQALESEGCASNVADLTVAAWESHKDSAFRRAWMVGLGEASRSPRLSASFPEAVGKP